MNQRRKNDMEYIWLDSPVHKNRVSGFSIDENSEVNEFLKVSFDGSIMAVAKDKVESHYREQKVDLIRHGYEKMPKKIKVDSEEGLFKFLAYFVTL